MAVDEAYFVFHLTNQPPCFHHLAPFAWYPNSQAEAARVRFAAVLNDAPVFTADLSDADEATPGEDFSFTYVAVDPNGDAITFAVRWTGLCVCVCVCVLL